MIETDPPPLLKAMDSSITLLFHSTVSRVTPKNHLVLKFFSHTIIVTIITTLCAITTVVCLATLEKAIILSKFLV